MPFAVKTTAKQATAKPINLQLIILFLLNRNRVHAGSSGTAAQHHNITTAEVFLIEDHYIGYFKRTIGLFPIREPHQTDESE